MAKITKNISGKDLDYGTIILNYLNNLTIKEQFRSLQSAKEIFYKSCIVLKTKGFNSNEIYIDCDEISPVRMSISYSIACFTILSLVNGEPDDRYLIDLSKYYLFI